MTDKTIIVLIDASSFYGRTVIDRLADTDWFYDEYDVRAVTDDTMGKAVHVLNAHDVPAIAVEDASAPRKRSSQL